MEEQNIKIKEVSGRKRFIIELNKVSERNHALNIRVKGRTPIKWDRYEREWYIEEEDCLPLYRAFMHNTAQKRMSDVGRQTKNIRDHTERIFKDKEARESFFRAVFRFRNMDMSNILLTAGFEPEAEIFQTFEEWKKLGLEIKRSGIGFFDLRPVETGSVQEENIVNSIAAKLEKREYQRLASFLIRKNRADQKCFDILQMSYEQEEETVTILSECQSKKELKEFIAEHVLDQEINLERATLTFFYPDTALDTEDPDDAGIVRRLTEKTGLRGKPDPDRLYNMLCWLCEENGIVCQEEGETIETAIRQRLHKVVWELTDSMYKEIVLMMLYVFYGIGQEYPELRYDLEENVSESEDYKRKKECLQDIKRTFDCIVYNIQNYMDREIVYAFDPSDAGQEADLIYAGSEDEEDVENDPEEDAFGDHGSSGMDMADAEEIYAMVFGGDEIESDLPADHGYEKIEGTESIWMLPEAEEESDACEEDDLTPAEREWIEETGLGEFHNVTVCLWQLREAYKQKYRGVPYKIFHEIYKEKVRKDRYEKKIELTLKACENLAELKDSFYYQIFTENREKPVLGAYFLNEEPDPVYIGDLIEIYSAQDDIYSLNYIDTKGFTEVSRDEFYEPSGSVDIFKKQYEKDRVLALEIHLKVDEQTDRVINALPQSVLKIPDTEDDIPEYRRKGVDMAGKIISMLPRAPVLVCNRGVSMLQDDESWIRENEPALYEELYSTNPVLRNGEIVPFQRFCRAVDAYQDAVWSEKDKGSYHGYDMIDFLIFGKAERTQEIYVYFSTIKIGETYQSFYDHVKNDMNRQYGRLYEEYRQRRKRNRERLTGEGRLAAKNEMDCYVEMVKAINRAVINIDYT